MLCWEALYLHGLSHSPHPQHYPSQVEQLRGEAAAAKHAQGELLAQLAVAQEQAAEASEAAAKAASHSAAKAAAEREELRCQLLEATGAKVGWRSSRGQCRTGCQGRFKATNAEARLTSGAIPPAPNTAPTGHC